MTDDLVKRLREACFLAFDDNTNDYHSAEEAASHIETLEAALRDIALMGPYPWRCIARAALGDKKDGN